MGKTSHGYFFCWQCGSKKETKKTTCPHCGKPYDINLDPQYFYLPGGGVGWSQNTHHPTFKRYTKNYWYISLIWLVGLSVLVPFLIVGSTRNFEWDKNGILSVAIPVTVIWLVGIVFLIKKFGRDRQDWQGMVASMEVITTTQTTNSRRQQNESVKYEALFNLDDGSQRSVTWNNESFSFRQLRVGDRVRFIGNKHIQYYEKYDKRSMDELVCAGCGGLCDAKQTFCHACGTILLKGL